MKRDLQEELKGIVYIPDAIELTEQEKEQLKKVDNMG